MLLKRIVLGVWLASLACLAWAYGPAAAQQRPLPQTGGAPNGRQFTPPYYVFSPDIPKDIVTYDLGAIGTQSFVSDLAWFTFIGLNWPAPADLKQRGVPDRQNVVGGYKPSGGEGGGGATLQTGPTVWETFKDSDDIFLNPPNRPSPFNDAERIPAPCLQQARANPAAARRTMTRTAKASEVLRGFIQATGQPLVDQNGEKVWYEVKVNRVYYDYVVNNRLYDSRYQGSVNIFFPLSSNTTGDEPTIKVKAAWKVMGGPRSRQPDDQSRFYTTQAFVYDPDTGRCSVQTMGLVGLHVVMKTAQLPQWSWATFEHVNNAPDRQTGPVSGVQYNFYNPKCTTCPVNTPPSPPTSTTPTQVVRVTPVSGDSPNVMFHTALKTLRADNVWQNYMLVDAQWSGTRIPLGVPAQPKFLANTTMETYVQGPTGTDSTPHGCINCHGAFAKRTDLDFQLTKAYPHKPNLGTLLRRAAEAAPRRRPERR